MQLSAPAILLAARAHGETAVIARMLTEQHGMVAAYVAGGRGRQLRPVVIPGNIVQAEIRARSDSHLPFARLELVTSRGPWLGEPLAAAAINWVTALTASALPERNPYPRSIPRSAACSMRSVLPTAPGSGSRRWRSMKRCFCASWAMAASDPR